MELNQRRYGALFLFVAALAPVALGVRLFILFAGVDPETGFFRSYSAVCTAFNIFSLALFFGAVSAGLLRGKEKPEKPRRAEPVIDEEPDRLIVPTDDEAPEETEEDPDALQGVSAGSQTWQGGLAAFSYFLLGFAMIAAPVASFFREAEALARIAAFFQIAAGVSFLIAATRRKPKKNLVFTFFSLTSVVYFALRMVSEYHTLDHPNKALYVGQLLFLLSAILFFLYQAELSFGHPAYSHPGLYASFTLLTAFFGLAVMLPRFLAALFGSLPLEPADLAILLSDLVVAFFAVVKAVSLRR